MTVVEFFRGKVEMFASLSACWSFWRGLTGKDTRTTLVVVPVESKASMAGGTSMIKKTRILILT